MSAIPPAPVRATVEDLMREEGKAELIGGKIVRFPMTGSLASKVAGRIYVLLSDHVDATTTGNAYSDGMGYRVPELPSGRETFGPDASYYAPFVPEDFEGFIAGPPDLAVEVRTESDVGPAAERDMAAKRDDYFEAGTKVVWDMDPVARTVTVYRAADPSRPETFRPGDRADAEPAVPGWVAEVARFIRG